MSILKHNRNYQIFNQIYLARLLAYLLVFACVLSSYNPMYSNKTVVIAVGIILIFTPHIIFLIHRKHFGQGMRKSFENIEYRAVYVDNLICGICIPLCYFYPPTTFVFAVLSYANLITIGGLNLLKKGWYILPVGILIGYVFSSRLYNTDHNTLLLSASGLLLGIHMLSIVYINYFNTLKLNKVKENLKHSYEALNLEKDKSEKLLLNILPVDIADELRLNGKVDPKRHDDTTVLFTDFKGFTQKSEAHAARELVKELHNCFKAFDKISEHHKIEKIKTIGDSYMAAGGLKQEETGIHKSVVLAAMEMAEYILNRAMIQREADGVWFEMRVGIHSGPVVAGIVGVKKFQYDIWGDTVNTASRMETHGEVGKVNISEDTYNIIKDDPHFSFEARGEIEAKGKGAVQMYFVQKV